SPATARAPPARVRTHSERDVPGNVAVRGALGGLPREGRRVPRRHPRGGGFRRSSAAVAQGTSPPDRRGPAPVRASDPSGSRPLVLHLQEVSMSRLAGSPLTAIPASPGRRVPASLLFPFRRRAGVRGGLAAVLLLFGAAVGALDFPVLTPSAEMFRRHR